MNIDVNTAMSYVMKLRYEVWVSCQYDDYDCYVSWLFASQPVNRCKYYIELSYKASLTIYFSYSGFVVIGVVEHQGRCSPKVEDTITSLVKIPCNKSK